MRNGGGKQKGGEFEREICKLLSLWVTGNKHKDVFWRSAMSGGRATVAHKRGDLLDYQGGDISSIHPDGHKLTAYFCIECKFHRDLEFGLLLFGRGKLARFWKEACSTANRHSRQPMLIAKQNRFETKVLLLIDSPLLALDVPRTILHAADSHCAIVDLKQLLGKKFPRKLIRKCGAGQ
jgi:hypothetical protein